jgi:putative transposase
MPWQECSKVDERLRFVARLLEGEKMAELCREALGMRYPAELYQPSSHLYRGLPPLEYPLHDQTITVTQCGRLCFGGRKINLSAVFAGHNVGVREVADHVWLISFMHYDLGFFDDQSCRVECAPNPFGAKVLPMSPE